MNNTEIINIPISDIRVANPRSRNKIKFQLIVSSVQAIGLKKPIIVARRERDVDGTQYDLVCGQGRMEAYLALGEATVPAVIIDASREEQFLMSLIENIARRPPSNLDLVREVRTLLQRNYTQDDIARKLGLDRTYINGIINLLEHGEEKLIVAVEGGRLPISVAIQIAKGAPHDMQLALSEAYEKGELRGPKLIAAKRIISKRIAKQQQIGKAASGHKKLTSEALVREYRRRIREQQMLIKKANSVRDRLLLLTSAMRTLFSDDHFVTLLRAEGIADMPEQLAVRLN